MTAVRPRKPPADSPWSSHLIPLFVGGKQVDVTLVDQEDVELLRERRWRLSLLGYAIAGHKTTRVWMSRLLAGVDSSDLFVHHRNGDPLDNRKANLQIVTHEEHRLIHYAMRRAA